jgi:hypothetical protein
MMPDLNSSFDSTDSTVSKRERSHSIPIASQHTLKRTPSEIQLDEDEAMAEYRDYAMFRRIVKGMERTQRTTRDCRWRHANNISLRSVYEARQEEKMCDYVERKLPAKLQMLDQSSLVGMLSHGDWQDEEDEESMPFPLEM